MDYPKGSDPYTARQYLLHHLYSPLISVESSPNSDVILQSILNDNDISMLSILKPYGNNVKYSIQNQFFKLTNNQLITKNYPSFPIRFEPSLPDLLSINSDLSKSSKSNSLHQLFSISSLELLLKKIYPENDDLYLTFFNKIITSNLITPFETFNHPISQIFIINYNNDSIDFLRSKIVEFRNYNFPKYFQIDDLLIHVFVLYDTTVTDEDEILQFQNLIKQKLSVSSTIIPIIFEKEGEEEFVEILKNENSTIDEELQRISLQKDQPFEKYFKIPKKLDFQFKSKIFEFISQYLIPHMERNIRIWDDQILAPRRSIASRFFSVSKKLFNNNNNENTSQFNFQDNYYHKSSPEQIIRKLADWSLILKDFKYSYSVYDFIKKDYTNDKAWIYVASTQEMCMVSLLLVQTQLPNTQPIDKNTLRKIRHDIVEPSLDNLSYTYKSRLNLKTYSLRTHLVVIELLLCMCLTYNMSWWWQDLIEKYLLKVLGEFDNHLVSSNQSLQVIKAILLERLGYSFGKFQSTDKFIDYEQLKVQSQDDAQEEGLYENEKKLLPRIDAASYGFNRYRKSSLWYLLSIKEWENLGNLEHIKFLLTNITETYDLESKDNWYDRKDLLLGSIKHRVE